MHIEQALMVSPAKQAIRNDGQGQMVIVTQLQSEGYSVSAIAGASVFLQTSVPNEKEHLFMRHEKQEKREENKIFHDAMRDGEPPNWDHYKPFWVEEETLEKRNEHASAFQAFLSWMFL